MVKKPYTIATKTGDRGTTSLLDGSRVAKFSHRPECYGVIDEANAYLGAVRAISNSERVIQTIITVQNHIYVINSELACPADKKMLLKRCIGETDLAFLDTEIEKLELVLQLPRKFVLYGGTIASAYADIARAVIRRAERNIGRLDAEEPLKNPIIKRYINRLSDLLFLLARYEEKESGVTPLHVDS